jgi:hypothetical protein
MSTITTRGRIGRAPTLTAGLLAVGVVIAPQALADPGDIGDASLWRTSPTCRQPKNIILSAQGSGVLEFEYRVIGGETTTHKSRPAAQPIMPRQVSASIPEGQIRWRVVAHDTDMPDFIDRGGDIFPLDTTAPPSSAVEAFCGNDPIAEQLPAA